MLVSSIHNLNSARQVMRSEMPSSAGRAPVLLVRPKRENTLQEKFKQYARKMNKVDLTKARKVLAQGFSEAQSQMQARMAGGGASVNPGELLSLLNPQAYGGSVIGQTCFATLHTWPSVGVLDCETKPHFPIDGPACPRLEDITDHTPYSDNLSFPDLRFVVGDQSPESSTAAKNLMPRRMEQHRLFLQAGVEKELRALFKNTQWQIVPDSTKVVGMNVLSRSKLHSYLLTPFSDPKQWLKPSDASDQNLDELVLYLMNDESGNPIIHMPVYQIALTCQGPVSLEAGAESKSHQKYALVSFKAYGQNDDTKLKIQFIDEPVFEDKPAS